MSDQAKALARFFRAVSDASLRLAADLESQAELPELTFDEVDVPQGRGQRQQQILELEGLGNERGMKTSAVAEAINYEVPNTYSTLQTLEKAGLVELIEGMTPQSWRLAARYRATAVVFMRMAGRIREGEWSTYGDLSIAVRGDTKAARSVGRAAATLPQFPHPERILMDGGLISPTWQDRQGRGADHCRKLLEEQGLRFIGDRADKGQKVDWEELRRRDENEPVTG